jgi:hypothetical protein
LINWRMNAGQTENKIYLNIILEFDRRTLPMPTNRGEIR